MKKETSTTKKAPAKKSTASKSDGVLSQVEGLLRERIADGGATTDHLQSILSVIKPEEAAAPAAPVAV